jgi:hypothetical protein
MALVTSSTAPSTAGRFTAAQYARQILGNMLGAAVFVVIVSMVPEPYRQWSMALLLGLAAIVYLRHGLGRIEWLFAAAIGACAVAGVSSSPAIGLGWLLHTISDAWHHGIGRPITSRIPMSSFGCAVFDPLIAIWFFLGAPTLLPF